MLDPETGALRSASRRPTTSLMNLEKGALWFILNLHLLAPRKFQFKGVINEDIWF